MAKERYTEKQKYEKICQILQMARHFTAMGYGNIRFVEEKEQSNDVKRT